MPQRIFGKVAVEVAKKFDLGGAKNMRMSIEHAAQQRRAGAQTTADNDRQGRACPDSSSRGIVYDRLQVTANVGPLQGSSRAPCYRAICMPGSVLRNPG